MIEWMECVRWNAYDGMGMMECVWNAYDGMCVMGCVWNAYDGIA